MCAHRAEGAFETLVAVQLSVLGLYRPPLLRLPLLLYPPELSLTGLAAEAGTAIALFAIFP